MGAETSPSALPEINPELWQFFLIVCFAKIKVWVPVCVCVC